MKQLFARVGDLETQIQRLSRLNTEAKASSSAAAAKICAAAASAPQKIEDNDDSDLFGSDNVNGDFNVLYAYFLHAVKSSLLKVQYAAGP